MKLEFATIEPPTNFDSRQLNASEANIHNRRFEHHVVKNFMGYLREFENDSDARAILRDLLEADKNSKYKPPLTSEDSLTEKDVRESNPDLIDKSLKLTPDNVKEKNRDLIDKEEEVLIEKVSGLFESEDEIDADLLEQYAREHVDAIKARQIDFQERQRAYSSASIFLQNLASVSSSDTKKIFVNASRGIHIWQQFEQLSNQTQGFSKLGSFGKAALTMDWINFGFATIEMFSSDPQSDPNRLILDAIGGIHEHLEEIEAQISDVHDDVIRNGESINKLFVAFKNDIGEIADGIKDLEKGNRKILGELDSIKGDFADLSAQLDNVQADMKDLFTEEMWVDYSFLYSRAIATPNSQKVPIDKDDFTKYTGDFFNCATEVSKLEVPGHIIGVPNSQPTSKKDLLKQRIAMLRDIKRIPPAERTDSVTKFAHIYLGAGVMNRSQATVPTRHLELWSKSANSFAELAERNLAFYGHTNDLIPQLESLIKQGEELRSRQVWASTAVAARWETAINQYTSELSNSLKRLTDEFESNRLLGLPTTRDRFDILFSELRKPLRSGSERERYATARFGNLSHKRIPDRLEVKQQNGPLEYKTVIVGTRNFTPFGSPISVARKSQTVFLLVTHGNVKDPKYKYVRHRAKSQVSELATPNYAKLFVPAALRCYAKLRSDLNSDLEKIKLRSTVAWSGPHLETIGSTVKQKDEFAKAEDIYSQILNLISPHYKGSFDEKKLPKNVKQKYDALGKQYKAAYIDEIEWRSSLQRDYRRFGKESARNPVGMSYLGYPTITFVGSIVHNQREIPLFTAKVLINHRYPVATSDTRKNKPNTYTSPVSYFESHKEDFLTSPFPTAKEAEAFQRETDAVKRNNKAKIEELSDGFYKRSGTRVDPKLISEDIAGDIETEFKEIADQVIKNNANKVTDSDYWKSKRTGTGESIAYVESNPETVKAFEEPLWKQLESSRQNFDKELINILERKSQKWDQPYISYDKTESLKLRVEELELLAEIGRDLQVLSNLPGARTDNADIIPWIENVKGTRHAEATQVVPIPKDWLKSNGAESKKPTDAKPKPERSYALKTAVLQSDLKAVHPDLTNEARAKGIRPEDSAYFSISTPVDATLVRLRMVKEDYEILTRIIHQAV